MNRLAIMLVLILAATVIGSRGTAIAFSLHGGQSQARHVWDSSDG